MDILKFSENFFCVILEKIHSSQIFHSLRVDVKASEKYTIAHKRCCDSLQRVFIALVYIYTRQIYKRRIEHCRALYRLYSFYTSLGDIESRYI